MIEKPLHVQVAVALPHRRIWQAETMTDIHDEWGDFSQAEPGDWIEVREHGGWYLVPRYDTDWSATGPLIKAFGIGVDLRGIGWAASKFPADFSWPGLVQFADDPLVAACYLILSLASEGKLEKQREGATA